MSSFDQGLAGMVSLQAINEWIGVINSNLGGSNRTAYKKTTVSFGGGVAQIYRDPIAKANGVQVPDSTLKVSHTSIDFSQGTIIHDGVLTHLAISGDAFFYVWDDRTLTPHFTRDGDFFWVPDDPNAPTQFELHNQEGLVVIDSGINRITRLATTKAEDVVLTTGLNTVSGLPPAMIRFPNNQGLKFSKFGSTIFDAAPGTFTLANFISDVEIVSQALESSNAALNDTLPELSLAQKLFSAVSKIINVHNSNLDTVVNLIR